MEELVRALVKWPMGLERGWLHDSMSRSRSSSGDVGWAGLRGEVGSRDDVDILCSEEASTLVTSVNTTITFFIGCMAQGGEH